MKYYKRSRAYLTNVLLLVSILSQVASNPYVITDDRIRNMDITPVLGRGYSLMTNTFHSNCLEMEEYSVPTYNYDYSFYDFKQSDDLEVSLAGELSDTFVYPQIKSEVNTQQTSTVTTTAETYYIVAVMRIERYYSSLREDKSRLTSDARTLLEKQDYFGFFKGCGPNFIRGIRRAQEVSAMFKFTSSSTEIATQFTESVKAASSGVTEEEGGVESTENFSTQSKFDTITSNLQIKISGFGLGLDGEGSESLIATSLEEFNRVMIFAFNTMVKNPVAQHVGMVYGIEIAPWVENIQFQVAAKLSDGIVQIPITRSLIPRAFRYDTNGKTRITKYDKSHRDEYICKDQGLEIDKYGYCCELRALYNYVTQQYDFTNPELRICRPLRQLDPSILRENMVGNAEFAVRLDNILQAKLNQLGALERCSAAVMSIPSSLDHFYLTPNDSVQYDKDIDFRFTVFEMKTALDPFKDYEIVLRLGKELDEFVDMYYQPCLAALYGTNVGRSPDVDTSYFMAYPWHTHKECNQLSCFSSSFRWDREKGGCVPGVLAGSNAVGYNGSDEFCSYDIDAGEASEQVCKYPTDAMRDYHNKLQRCWGNVLPSGQIDYFMEHYCMPTVGGAAMEEDKINDLKARFSSSCTGSPTPGPSMQPSSSVEPSDSPSSYSSAPSTTSSSIPSSRGTTLQPSIDHSSYPSSTTSSSPSTVHTSTPSINTSTEPSILPSDIPTQYPSSTTSSSPSTAHTSTPSINTSSEPSILPSGNPTQEPSQSQSPSSIPSQSQSPSSIPTNTPIKECSCDSRQKDYRGLVSSTVSDRTCQKWTEQRPHQHDFQDIGDHNFCRNPDDGSQAWCYTTDPDVRWEYCSVPYCSNPGECKECACDDEQRDYRGMVATTETGKVCQNWTEQRPHRHTKFQDHPEYTGLGDHNFCRNPDDGSRAWCFTTDPDVRWEYCTIPSCRDPNDCVNLEDYYDTYYGFDDNGQCYRLQLGFVSNLDQQENAKCTEFKFFEAVNHIGNSIGVGFGTNHFNGGDQGACPHARSAVVKITYASIYSAQMIASEPSVCRYEVELQLPKQTQSPKSTRSLALDYLDKFYFYPFKNSGGNNINNHQGSLFEAARDCHLDPVCKGFNSNGWMKHTIEDESQWGTSTTDNTKGLYVKKVDYLDQFDFFEYIDSEGNNLKVRDDITIEELAKACYLEQGCEGFNSNGEMKQTIRDRFQWVKLTSDPSKGLYVLKDL